jgi:hypothetical protein
LVHRDNIIFPSRLYSRKPNGEEEKSLEYKKDEHRRGDVM